MKTPALNFFLFLFVLLGTTQFSYSTSYQWVGNTSTDWATGSNWSPSGIPDSADHITVSSGTYNLVLDQNRRVSNLTLSTKTINLNGHSLTVYGTATMTSGTVTGGNFIARGSLAAFNGTLMDCPVDAVCGYIRLSGSTFNETADFTDTGTATGTGTGGCTFNDDVTITHGGTLTYFTLANTNGDTFNGNVTFTNNSNRELYVATDGSTQFNGNIILNSTSTGGILFGNGTGTSSLASGKTVSIGTSGFSADFLTLKNFTQSGSTAQSLTLTGSAAVNMIGVTFNGNLTVSAPGFLMKNSIFNGTSSFTKTGTGNHQSDGGNTFNGATTIAHTGASGRIRMATITGDTYNADVTFNSSGQDVQIAYLGNNSFTGNITINSNKVVFNTSTGKVTFTGTNNQTLNGSYNYPFKKLSINKTSGTVTANTTLSVDDSLIFIQGNLITTSTNLLTMKHGSTATGASNSSFVSGPVKKIGNSEFVFNIGSGTTYRPLTITAPSNTTDAFTAEYYSTGQALGATKDTTITFVSDCGYWKLDRTTGTSNITPKFAFDTTHCDYLSVKPIHIALWNGTKWTDKGEAVTESTNKTTSTTMTSYGYFAFAYNLVPGDAPQMPYPLTIGSTCNAVELLFPQNDMWFSFTPDSAVVKGVFTSPDSLKTYSYIKSASIYEAYQAGDTLQAISIKTWPFDSILYNFQNFVVDLMPGETYLWKVSKFLNSDGPGIYDTIDYYINLCLLNLRMQMSPTFHCYDSQANLVNILGTLANPIGLTRPGDVVLPCTTNVAIDLATLSSPLLVEEGVTFCGNYDLLSEPYDVSIPGETRNIVTSPLGTLLANTERRGEWIPPSPGNAAGLLPEGYLIYMMPQSTVRNIRLQGPMPGFQDYNFDTQLCAGIRTFHNATDEIGPFEILHCEIYNFSYAAIDIMVRSDDVTVDNCYIHHISGAGGETTPKGYGIWAQGNVNNDDPVAYLFRNTIFDESKEAIDISPNPSNATIEYCSFGEFFGNENINRHLFNASNYVHPISLNWTPPSNCFYNNSHSTGCSINNESLSSMYQIGRLSAGNVNINNCVFHQDGMNISLGYPYNPHNILTPLFNINISKNTFAHSRDLPGTYASSCGLGGYARIDNINIEECTWEYERNHNIDGEYLLGTYPNPIDPKPILTNSPNAFSYVPGSVVNNSTSPQPPEVKVTFDATDYVSGYSPNTPTVPYYSLNDNIEVSLSHGIIGSPSQKVAYLARAKANEGASISNNASGNNAYNNSQYVTLPLTSVQTLTNTHLNWTTDKPGLYGIDAYAIDGNYSSTSSSTYLTSKLIHNPVIIEPTTNYILTFNIKDSYYSQLNATTGLTGVKKQVELNGNVIWQEDISQGGDDWEYVMINIDADSYPASGPSATPIKSFLNENGFQNEITFSISIANPSNVNTSGIINLLRGVRIWVDDIYLKKFNSAENLISDGDVENSVASELLETSNAECIWYRKNQVTFAAYHLDDTDEEATLDTDLYTSTKVSLNSVDRKSGLRAIQLMLPPLKFSGSIGIATNYGIPLFAGTPGLNNEFISAAVNFDIRDLYSCNGVADILGYTSVSSAPTVTVSDEKILITDPWIITSDLTIENSDLLFDVSTPPLSISVQNGATLTVTGSQNDSTYLGGCRMWGGIIVEPGCTLNIDGQVTGNGNHLVTIEDSYLAISALGDGVTTSDEPVINLEGVKFNNNLISIQLKNDNYNASKVKGCYFSCDGGYIAKDPTISFLFPDAHVYLVDATYTDSNPMFTSVGSKLCIFEEAYLGISATRSDVFSGNCEFRNLIKNANPLLKGIGIRASNNSSTELNLNVSSRFRNLSRGIFSVGNFNINIHDLDYFRDMDVAAVSLFHSNYNNDIEINNVGNFERSNIGIVLSGSNFGTVNISNNTFTNTGFVETSTGSFHNTAISIQSAIANPFNVVVSNNNITDYRIGIHALNVDGIEVVNNGDNTALGIHMFNHNVSFSPNEIYRGIWLQNCPHAFVAENKVSNNVEITSLTTAFRGIDIEKSVRARLNCNEVSGIPFGMNFLGYCNGTLLRANEFSQYQKAINLETATLPPQAQWNDVNSDLEPLDNLWNDPPVGAGNPATDRVFGSSTTQITWFYRPPVSGTANPFNPLDQMSSGIVSAVQDNASMVYCNDITDRVSRDIRFGAIVGDSLEFDSFEEENTWMARKYAYECMKLDSTILYQDSLTDGVYIDFYQREDSLNTGKFSTIRVLSSDSTTFGNAESMNELVFDEIDLETNLKFTNQTYFDRIAVGDTLDSSDTTALLAISDLPYFSSGEAFYMSIGMLGLEKSPYVPALRIGQEEMPMAIETISQTKPDVIIYPNPATLSFTIQSSNWMLQKVEVYDSQKRLVHEGKCSGILQEISAHFKPGIYGVKVIGVNNEIRWLKLIIL